MPPAVRPPGRGLEGYQIKAIGLGLYVWGLAAMVLLIAGGLGGLGGLRMLLLIVFGGGAAGGATTLTALYFAHHAGRAAQALYAPTGASTPYERTFSYQQAMAMRGDVAGALASFEALITENPDDPAVRLAAAQMYSGPGGVPARAAELYREVRRLPGASATHEFTATNALIDLYRGALADPGAVRSELRRLASRFAGTAPGELARRALDEPPDAPRPRADAGS